MKSQFRGVSIHFHLNSSIFSFHDVLLLSLCYHSPLTTEVKIKMTNVTQYLCYDLSYIWVVANDKINTDIRS